MTKEQRMQIVHAIDYGRGCDRCPLHQPNQEEVFGCSIEGGYCVHPKHLTDMIVIKAGRFILQKKHTKYMGKVYEKDSLKNVLDAGYEDFITALDKRNIPISIFSLKAKFI